jgi:hypothetical protein
MATKKAVAGNPLEKMLADMKAAQEKQMAEMIEAAKQVPGMPELAKAIFDKTFEWAKASGISGIAPTKISAVAQRVAAAMDKLEKDIGSNISDDYKTAYIKIAEAIIGENIETKFGRNSTTHISFQLGTAITMLKNVHGHGYPLGKVIFVTKPDVFAGILCDGTTPAALHFEASEDCIGVPDEAQVLGALAVLSVSDNAKFLEIAEMSK